MYKTYLLAGTAASPHVNGRVPLDHDHAVVKGSPLTGRKAQVLV